MIFFYLKEINISFSKYLGFCGFVKSTDFKICEVTIDTAT